MQNKFPALSKWTEELRTTVFSASVSLNDAFLTKLANSEQDVRLRKLRAKGHLPWIAPNNGGAVGVGGVFVSSIADTIPIVGQLRRNTRMRQQGGKTPEDDAQSSWQYIGLIGSVIAGLGLVAGYMFHEGLIPYGPPKEEQKVGLGAFGEAGDALSFFATAMDADVERQRRMENSTRAHGEPMAEVEVDSRGVTATDTIM
jgi:sorting and assembly machinery component 37